MSSAKTNGSVTGQDPKGVKIKNDFVSDFRFLIQDGNRIALSFELTIPGELVTDFELPGEIIL